MKTIKVKISDSKYRAVLDLVGEYQIPKNKEKSICEYLCQKLAELGIEVYDGLGHSKFYEWISDDVAGKFKLKPYED